MYDHTCQRWTMCVLNTDRHVPIRAHEPEHLQAGNVSMIHNVIAVRISMIHNVIAVRTNNLQGLSYCNREVFHLLDAWQ